MHHYAPPPRTSGLSVASLVLGLLWLGWIGSILALIFGHAALNQIDQADGWMTGRGMAWTGIVLGWIGVFTFGLVFVLPWFV